MGIELVACLAARVSWFKKVTISIDLEPDEFGRQRGKPIGVACCVAWLEDDVLRPRPSQGLSAPQGTATVLPQKERCPC